jgi:hypothetical protein
MMPASSSHSTTTERRMKKGARAVASSSRELTAIKRTNSIRKAKSMRLSGSKSSKKEDGDGIAAEAAVDADGTEIKPLKRKESTQRSRSSSRKKETDGDDVKEGGGGEATSTNDEIAKVEKMKDPIAKVDKKKSSRKLSSSSGKSARTLKKEKSSGKVTPSSDASSKDCSSMKRKKEKEPAQLDIAGLPTIAEK